MRPRAAGDGELAIAAPGRRLLLVIGGGIAAYKALELIRLARQAGHTVRCVLTRAATEFVTPLSVATLSGEKAFTELFDLTDELEIGHIRLAREADAIIVAPATADLLARMAQGRADDLATTVLLAADVPILAAPAMNWRMWEHPATRRNMAQLLADGLRIVGPEHGAMACNEHGVGRMAEPADILAAAGALLGGGALAGRHVLVTAGPTHEPVDPVRYIANRSSGRQGYAIAAAAAALGADVTLVSGPTALAPPAGVRLVAVQTAAEMLAATLGALPADIAVMCAAVADWRADAAPVKLKKGQLPRLALAENPDILATVARHAQRPHLVIGFAAETGDLAANAAAKRAAKGADWIVGNDVSPGSDVFGGPHNAVLLVTAAGSEMWPRLAKREVAERLMRRAAEQLAALRREAAE